MTDQVMTNSHNPTMNLRFVSRNINGKEVRILQQMMVPIDWDKHEEFWKDIPCVVDPDVVDSDPWEV